MRIKKHILLFIILIGASTALVAQDKHNALKDLMFYFKGSGKGMQIETFSRVKVGFGLPYGILGVSGEIGVGRLSVNGGLGYVALRGVSGKVGYSAGAKIYVLKDDKKLKPRFCGQYGTNNVYVIEGLQHYARGFSAGAGFEHKLSDRLTYEIDYILILNNTNNYRPEKRALESVAFPSFGIGYIF